MRDIDTIAKENENKVIEWKESWQDKYLEWICGYANAQGGTLYIGINDDGDVVGLDAKTVKKLLEDMDQSIEDSYLRAIESCSRYWINDYTAISIINEEMPAYFYGQKSLDDVIAIINNRVSLLQDERG